MVFQVAVWRVFHRNGMQPAHLLPYNSSLVLSKDIYLTRHHCAAKGKERRTGPEPSDAPVPSHCSVEQRRNLCLRCCGRCRPRRCRGTGHCVVEESADVSRWIRIDDLRENHLTAVLFRLTDQPAHLGYRSHPERNSHRSWERQRNKSSIARKQQPQLV